MRIANLALSLVLAAAVACAGSALAQDGSKAEAQNREEASILRINPS